MHYRHILDSFKPLDPPAETREHSHNNGNVINLALNENSLGCSPQVTQALMTALSSTSRYPSMFCDELRVKLINLYNLKSQNIVFGSCIFEILSLISAVFIGEEDEVIIPAPSFGWYNLVTRLNGGRIIPVQLKPYTIDLDAVLDAITPATRLIWLCNPHNPMGTILSSGALQSFLAKVPVNIAVVFDEAYREYAVAPDVADGIELVREFENLIVLRTFSKAYGLAGLRIGFAVTGAEIASLLHKVKIPPNVNQLAQVAALAALDDAAFLTQSVSLVRQGLQDYYAVCDELGLGYIPSFANFLMIDVERDSDEAASVFLDAGIKLRSGKEVGLASWIRVTIGTAQENQRVFAVLRQLAAERNA